MLIQSSLPGSIEAALSFVSDHGKGNWLVDAETWQKCSKWEKNHGDGYEVVPVIEGKRNIEDRFSLNFASSCFQLSTVGTMSENSTPAFVYRRRKLHKNLLSLFPAQSSAKPSGGCVSAISSEAPSLLGKEGHIASAVDLESVVTDPVRPPVDCSREVLVLKSESINRCLVGEESSSKEALKSDIPKALDFGCINDSYSSSKSNVELGSASLRTEVDDTGECSSSSALVVEGLQDDQSETALCISILRSQGLLERVWPIRIHTSAEGSGISSESSYIRTCKACDHPENTLKMLICDKCEEAFHVSCCNTLIKKIPVDEWFCHSCLKKKRKILTESITSKALNISSEVSRCRNATSEGELGPIASMLIDIEPYKPGVRIGRDFQAEVPDWSGPFVDEVDALGEPSEINTSDCVRLQGCNSNKPSRLSSIGNWLQCREVIEGIGEGVNGTICGKWRRAPLFEVQTDDWECFRAVLWDPAHADCAVPQALVVPTPKLSWAGDHEPVRLANSVYRKMALLTSERAASATKELDTDQVLKHLKYIEMLRPGLAAKRRKLDLPKNVSSRNLAEEVRNIITP